MRSSPTTSVRYEVRTPEGTRCTGARALAEHHAKCVTKKHGRSVAVVEITEIRQVVLKTRPAKAARVNNGKTGNARKAAIIIGQPQGEPIDTFLLSIAARKPRPSRCRRREDSTTAPKLYG